MTPAEFRGLALNLPQVVEGAHMGHADFRVAGRIIATLGYPNQQSAVVMLTLEDQSRVVRDHPGTFSLVASTWGARGSTTVDLGGADIHVVARAIEAAWRKRAAPCPSPFVAKRTRDPTAAPSHFVSSAREHSGHVPRYSAMP